MKIVEIDGYPWTADVITIDETTNFLVLVNPKKYNYSTRNYDSIPYSRIAVPLTRVVRILEVDDA
ncbi:MAG: hypothetical protein QXG39_02595 [Candidatus Aenigmatarchaeota archaeon]